jgi:hypothetical protein
MQSANSKLQIEKMVPRLHVMSEFLMANYRAIWWQITVRQIGSGHVLIALVVFQDGSWVRTNLSCEPLYGKLDCLIWYHFCILSLYCSFCSVAVLAITLLNIHESTRFKKGEFRFWGCLPVYSPETAENAGASEAQIRHRLAEVHQLSMHVILYCPSTIYLAECRS